MSYSLKEKLCGGYRNIVSGPGCNKNWMARMANISTFAAQPTPKKKLTKKPDYALFIPHSRSSGGVALEKIVKSKIQNFIISVFWKKDDQTSGRHALPLHVIHEVTEYHFKKLTSRPHQSFLTFSSPMLHLRRVACRVSTFVFG